MIIAVCGHPELDCLIEDRVFNWFDTEMATTLLILRAMELRLVAHRIAGFRPPEVKLMLGIGDDMQELTLVILRKHTSVRNRILPEKQLHNEVERPACLSFGRITFVERIPDRAAVSGPIPY